MKFVIIASAVITAGASGTAKDAISETLAAAKSTQQCMAKWNKVMVGLQASGDMAKHCKSMVPVQADCNKAGVTFSGDTGCGTDATTLAAAETLAAALSPQQCVAKFREVPQKIATAYNNQDNGDLAKYCQALSTVLADCPGLSISGLGLICGKNLHTPTTTTTTTSMSPPGGECCACQSDSDCKDPEEECCPNHHFCGILGGAKQLTDCILPPSCKVCTHGTHPRLQDWNACLSAEKKFRDAPPMTMAKICEAIAAQQAACKNTQDYDKFMTPKACIGNSEKVMAVKGKFFFSLESNTMLPAFLGSVTGGTNDTDDTDDTNDTKATGASVTTKAVKGQFFFAKESNTMLPVFLGSVTGGSFLLGLAFVAKKMTIRSTSTLEEPMVA